LFVVLFLLLLFGSGCFENVYMTNKSI